MGMPHNNSLVRKFYNSQVFKSAKHHLKEVTEESAFQ